MTNGLILLTYNAADQLRANWGALTQTKWPLVMDIRDNASTDDTVPLLTSAGAKVHANEINVGYSAGINQGLRALMERDLEWVFIVNPDVCCPPQWDAAILDSLTETDHIGIIGTRLIGPGGGVLHTGGIVGKPQLLYWPVIQTLGNGWSVVEQEAVTTTQFRHRISDCRETQRTAWATFAAVALRMSMIREVGLLDETYFLYCSDAQYAMRALAAGWETWYCPATFRHEGSASVRRADAAIQAQARADIRRFALMEERTWLQSLGDRLP